MRAIPGAQQCAWPTSQSRVSQLRAMPRRRAPELDARFVLQEIFATLTQVQIVCMRLFSPHLDSAVPGLAANWQHLYSAFGRSVQARPLWPSVLGHLPAGCHRTTRAPIAESLQQIRPPETLVRVAVCCIDKTVGLRSGARTATPCICPHGRVAHRALPLWGGPPRLDESRTQVVLGRTKILVESDTCHNGGEDGTGSEHQESEIHISVEHEHLNSLDARHYREPHQSSKKRSC